MTKKEAKEIQAKRALAKQGDMNKENEDSYLQGIFASRKHVYRLKSGLFMKYSHVYLYVSFTDFLFGSTSRYSC